MTGSIQDKSPLDPKSILPWESTHIPDYMNTADVENSPLSLVIPIYNSGMFLEKTLRSILLSDLRNVQIIVSDGGSTDNTLNIIDHYSCMFDIVISEPDNGQSDAINKGFVQATGELYGWLNGDDILLPYALNHVRNSYIANGKPDFMVGNAYMTEIDFTPIHHFVFSEEKLSFEYLLDYASHHLIQPSAFFSKHAWHTYGNLDVDDHYAMDADLFIALAKNFKAHWINQDLAYSVYHEDCKTRGKRAESITNLAMVQAKYGGLTEARKTLDILVDLYNQTVSQSNDRVLSNLGSFTDFQKEIYYAAMKADIPVV